MVFDVREGEDGVLLVNMVINNGRVVLVVVAPLRDAGEEGAEEKKGRGREGGEVCWEGGFELAKDRDP